MDSATINTVWASLGAIVVLVLAYLRATREKLDHIPTVGHSNWLLSYLDVYRRGADISVEVKEGYEKYPNSPFKVAIMHHWKVIVSGERALDDIRLASDSQISFMDAVRSSIQLKHTVGTAMADNPTHIPVIKNPLTRNLQLRFGDLNDEITEAFKDNLSCKGDEWADVHTQALVMNVVARTSNRYFVGLPLCRDPEWVRLNIMFTLSVVALANKINGAPIVFAPLIAWWNPGLKQEVAIGCRLLGPIVQERLEQDAAHGDDWDRPNDLITWLLDEAKTPVERDIEMITRRVLNVNFAAIHTSTLTFMNALFTVAADASLQDELREEVTTVTEKYGWNKDGMAHLIKMDSVYKESQRFYGLGATLVERKTLVDFTLSDGTVLPTGTTFTVATDAMHHDEAYTKNADTMDPFRYSRMRAVEGEFTKHQMVAPDRSYLTFGYGKHACPGRFFAANEVKAMMAHVLFNYDMKTEQEGVRPSNLIHGRASIPDPMAHTFWRRRV